MWRQLLAVARGWLILAIAMPAVAVGCIEVPRPKTGDDLKPRAIRHDSKAAVVEACTPTGIELCFDAIDNNCNGIIDEGCGLRTGVLQFTIAWAEANADVDLIVSGPDGSKAGLGTQSAAGLIKDRDCPGRQNACYGQNVENVYLKGTSVQRGRYIVELKVANTSQLDAPLKVQLSMRLGPHYLSSVVQLRSEEPKKRFEFTL